MRRVGLFCILLICITLSAASQVAFGLRAGGAVSSLSQKVHGHYESGSRFGYSVAGVADIPLTFIYKRISFRPELVFCRQSGFWLSNNNLMENTQKNMYTYHSLQVPANLAFTFPFYDIRITLFAGPSLDFSLGGTGKSYPIDYSPKAPELSSVQEKPSLTKFDLGVNLGFAVKYREWFFAINVNSGTLDRRTDQKEEEPSIYQNNATFSLGYFFYLVK